MAKNKVFFHPQDLLTHEQAAALIGLQPKTLYKYTSEGKLPYYKLGGRNRYLPSDVLALVKPASPTTTTIQKAINAHFLGQNQAA